ncbi:sigma-70 family RNA polymerase sigma factor [Sutcliffiella horikoshii]|uniref:sigma-70 family RNA polymerase sigma factor n=1 Tax=Sutcliffiella horikoshii TaxID=79883 RepID=UPI00203E8FCB|nr:sigma-70 family RNA polymerase sigma factor [Sutcliffiella horikoshii]MCM3616643.1 sigma-70 family RNA polymerase sigma factor [Sutcliffiella horikoshii]
MESTFEEVLIQYTPMIHHIIKSLNIYKDKDQYFHEATIVLWEIMHTQDHQKGSFTSYAYSSIKGKLLNHLKNEVKWESNHAFVEHLPEQSYLPSLSDMESLEGLEKYAPLLTGKQKTWLIAYIGQGRKIEEIALQEGVSISAVKSWRTEAIRKLRKELVK